MTSPTTALSTGTVGTITMANIAGATIFGIAVDHIAAALLITVCGVFGRLGWEIYSSIKRTGTVKWAQVFGLSAAGLISAISITILVLAVLKGIGIVNDNTTLLCLLFFGFIGPDSLPWLFNLATTIIKKQTGATLPPISANGDIQP